MDLASKAVLLQSLEKIRDKYRSDTEIGQRIREGVEKCIHHIQDSYQSQLFSLEHLGESDLNYLLHEANKKLNELTKEPEIKVFKINGYYNDRYTKSHDKAKEILKEEFDLMLENIQEDYADSKIDLQMKTIKQSNLKDYKIE